MEMLVKTICFSVLAITTASVSADERFATPEGAYGEYLRHAPTFIKHEHMLSFFSVKKRNEVLRDLNAKISRIKGAPREYFITQTLSEVRNRAMCERLTLSSIESVLGEGRGSPAVPRKVVDKGEVEATLTYSVTNRCKGNISDSVLRVNMVLEGGVWKIN